MLFVDNNIEEWFRYECTLVGIGKLESKQEKGGDTQNGKEGAVMNCCPVTCTRGRSLFK